jgi:glutathione peroxidase
MGYQLMYRKKMNTKLKKLLIVVLVSAAAFAVYVEIANRNSKQMTYRQKILKAVYPAFMWFTKLTGMNSKQIHAEEGKEPPVSFYSLKSVLNNGDTIDLSQFKGKKLLIVNTASNCGYTNQYTDLQKLADEYKDKLTVLGFPANDFKEQEKGTDEEIATFCKLNFGVTFPLMKKSVVIKSNRQHPVFQWLTDTSKNGWNKKAPSWNFSKYLVDEKGVLTNYFDPSVSPLSDIIRTAIEK